MAILGVLLGITMTVLGYCVWTGYKERLAIRANWDDLHSRLAFLERRDKQKTILTEGTSHPKANGVASVKLRTWSEDAPAAEAVNR